MKSIKKVAIGLFILAFSSQAYSQLSLGGQMSLLHAFGDYGVNNVGLGIKGEYSVSDDNIITVGVNYYFPTKFSETIIASASSSTTKPSSVVVEAEHTLSFIHFFGGAKRYFVGDYEDDFGFYGIGEAGFLLGPWATKLSSFDKSLYHADYEDGQKTTHFCLTLNLGLGVEKRFDFGYLFADMRLNLPANLNGDAIASEAIVTACFNGGIRIPF